MSFFFFFWRAPLNTPSQAKRLGMNRQITPYVHLAYGHPIDFEQPPQVRDFVAGPRESGGGARRRTRIHTRLGVSFVSKFSG